MPRSMQAVWYLWPQVNTSTAPSSIVNEHIVQLSVVIGTDGGRGTTLIKALGLGTAKVAFGTGVVPRARAIGTGGGGGGGRTGISSGCAPDDLPVK